METPKVVLDTDILVGLLRDVKDIVRFVKRLEEEGIPQPFTRVLLLQSSPLRRRLFHETFSELLIISQ